MDPATWAAIGVGTTAASAEASAAAAGVTLSSAELASITAAQASVAAISNSLLIGGIGAIGLGGMSYMQASKAQSEQEAQIKAAYEAQQRAIAADNRQIVAQESLEKKKAISQSRLLLSRIRVTAGESGLGIGGTYENLMRQTDYDSWLNTQIIGQNASNQLAQAAGRMQPQPFQAMSPLLDGLSAGIGGFSTGLGITRQLRAM